MSSPENFIEFMAGDVLRSLGYSPSQIIKNYDYSGEDGSSMQANLVAFSDDYRHDLATACIAVHWCSDFDKPEDIINNFRYIATPIGIVASPTSVQIFPVKISPPHKPIIDLRHEDVRGYFSTNRLNFTSESLMASKRGARQLTWFDIDTELVQFAEGVSQKILVSRFESAVRAGLDLYAPKLDEAANSAIVRTTIKLLAARVLEDKKALPGSRAADAQELLLKAHREFKDYFSLDDFNVIGWKAADEMLGALTGGLTFRAFSNELLGYLYEKALISPELQKASGVFYTPRYLAEAILDRLPVEDIAEDKRYVMDGTCGSGNLLLAAYDRLKRLLPSSMEPTDKHGFLTEHVWGIDRDEFASEAARLSLLLFSLPLGNSWNIHAADFLEDDCSLFYPDTPRIIVGNPPFRHYRGEGEIQQVAKRFVARYLDQLESGGLMGILLPETVLVNKDCADLRRRVLLETDVLEVWHLPAGAIPSSSVELAVLILRKHGPGGNPVRVRQVIGRDKKRFLSKLVTTYDYVVPDQRIWLQQPDASMSSSHLDVLWHRLKREVPRFGDYVIEIHNGIQQYDSPADIIGPRPEGQGFKPWLKGSSVLQPYGIVPDEDLFIDYDRVKWRRKKYKWMFDSPKVIINGRRPASNPWRVYAAIDRVGYYPNETLHFTIPVPGIPLEEITAVINNAVLNAWMDSNNPGRTLAIPRLKLAPYPVFSPEIRQEVVEKVRRIEALRAFGECQDPEQIRELVKQVDQLVYMGYGLSQVEIESLEHSFAGCPRPGWEWKDRDFIPEAVNAGDTFRGQIWRVDGYVQSVDPYGDSMRVVVQGINDDKPFQVRIPKNVPGWALSEGVCFKADIPMDLVGSESLPEWAFLRIEPMPLSYVQNDQLNVLLRKALFRGENP